MNSWLPIESAPRGGEDIILFTPESDIGYFWGIHIGHFHMDHEDESMWLVADDGDGLWTTNPTHWQPLPAPPADAVKGWGE